MAHLWNHKPAHCPFPTQGGQQLKSHLSVTEDHPTVWSIQLTKESSVSSYCFPSSLERKKKRGKESHVADANNSSSRGGYTTALGTTLSWFSPRIPRALPQLTQGRLLVLDLSHPRQGTELQGTSYGPRKSKCCKSSGF